MTEQIQEAYEGALIGPITSLETVLDLHEDIGAHFKRRVTDTSLYTTDTGYTRARMELEGESIVPVMLSVGNTFAKAVQVMVDDEKIRWYYTSAQTVEIKGDSLCFYLTEGREGVTFLTRDKQVGHYTTTEILGTYLQHMRSLK